MKYLIVLALVLSGCATTRLGQKWTPAEGSSQDEMYQDSQTCIRAAEWAGERMRGEMAMRCMKSKGHQLQWVEI